MFGYFPSVGVVGKGALIDMMRTPAMALGVELMNFERDPDAASLRQCAVTTWIGDSVSISQVKTLENAGVRIRPNSTAISFTKEWNERCNVTDSIEATFSVLVACSPHGQASAWTPTRINDRRTPGITVTPGPDLTPDQTGIAQTLALNLAKESGAIGVVDVEIFLKDENLFAGHLLLGPTRNGSWTIEGSRTSQFEQHLRAILDLPLGSPALTAPFSVSGTYSGEGNMYRPYLHLMARSPGLKFHQYRSETGQARGHVTAMGGDLLDLKECVAHAIEYMSGVVDE